MFIIILLDKCALTCDGHRLRASGQRQQWHVSSAAGRLQHRHRRRQGRREQQGAHLGDDYDVAPVAYFEQLTLAMLLSLLIT